MLIDWTSFLLKDMIPVCLDKVIKSLVISFFFAATIFIIIDAIWLMITVKLFYKPLLGSLLLDKPILWAAILFYLVYPMGLTFVILKPAIEAESIALAFWTGLVFGIVAYGTYNLTNMATIKNWSSTVVFVDLIWGGLLTGITSGLVVYIMKNLISTN